MSWELIGGDPAPGSPDAVRTASSAMTAVADLAMDAVANLRTATSGIGMERWKGTAADTFRTGVAELPASLKEVETSYRDAARALSAFAWTLEQEQARARAQRTAAEQADADRTAARNRLRAAEGELGSLRSQRRGADLHLASLRTQQAVTLDPVQRASMDSSVAAARSRAGRLAGEVSAAEQSVARHTAAVGEAEDRLERAAGEAAEIRTRLSGAVDTAVRALKAAEKEANLPGFWERTTAQLKEDLQTYGPAIVDALDKMQMVLSIAAVVFPPGAAVFTGAALLVGGLSLATSIGITATSEEGFTRENVLGLVVKAAGVAAGATAFGAAAKLSSAAKLAKAGQTALARNAIATAGRLETATTWIGRAQDAGEMVRGGVANGWEGFGLAAGGYVLGKAGTAVAGRALRETISLANRNPGVSRALAGMSRALGDENPSRSIVGVDLDGLPNMRATQSLLGSGAVPPGGLLPGNTASTAPSILDQAVSGQELRDFSREVVDPAVSEGVDTLQDRAEDRAFPEPAQRGDLEIDIDLNPSSYGGGR